MELQRIDTLLRFPPPPAAHLVSMVLVSTDGSCCVHRRVQHACIDRTEEKICSRYTAYLILKPQPAVYYSSRKPGRAEAVRLSLHTLHVMFGENAVLLLACGFTFLPRQRPDKTMASSCCSTPSCSSLSLLWHGFSCRLDILDGGRNRFHI